MAELQQKALASGGGRSFARPANAEPQLVLPPPSVDLSAVLTTISELGGRIDRVVSIDHDEIERIHVEVSDIAGRIKATKAEMATLRHPLSRENRFTTACEELGAVVDATETATDAIMASAKAIEEIVEELRPQLLKNNVSARLNDVSELVVRVYEACNFQDLSGQRIAKVVQTLSFIEERIDAMMSLWNRREFETMPLPPALARHDGDLELTGPSSVGAPETISQAEIDALFG